MRYETIRRFAQLYRAVFTNHIIAVAISVQQKLTCSFFYDLAQCCSQSQCRNRHGSC